MGLGSIGKAINSITGASSSASQANRYALQNAAVNNAYQKEFAQNAHQWEMEDLKKAGLNPALATNGGASASGGGSFGGSTGTPAGNPLDLLGNIVSMKNQTSATESQNNLNEANALLAIAQADNIPKKLKLEAMNALSNNITAKANATNANTNKKTARYVRTNLEHETKKKWGGKVAEYLGTWYTPDWK